MIYGLYLSGHGADLQTRRLEYIANNLANASTSGFKRDFAVLREALPFDLAQGAGNIPLAELEAMTGGVVEVGTGTDHSAQPPLRTGQALDVALLRGDQFLRVKKGTEEFLTRDGRLMLDGNRQLVTQSGGFPVLDDAGEPITVPFGNVTITRDGRVSVTDRNITAPVAALGIASPNDLRQLVKLGENLLRSTGKVTTDVDRPSVAVQQYHLEPSGVKPVNEMLSMIEASRQVEANINLLKIQEQTLEGLFSLARR